MHALSKKLYYDVLKSGLEETILETDFEGEEYEQGDTPKSTSEVGCSARTHMKSNALQTQWSYSGKNFRHEYTSTSNVKLLKRPVSRVIAIHRSVSCEDIAVTRVRGVQTTNSAEVPKIRGNKSVAVDLFGLQVVNNISTSTRFPYSSRVDECVSTECNQSDKCEETCNCDDYDSVPCNRGLASCRNFTLGTAEFRRSQKEICRTKLIGGCRVPVCKNNKSRF